MFKYFQISILIAGDHGQGAGGSATNGPSIMVHLDYAVDKRQKGNIEELFIHEASHACLDQHMKVGS